MESPPPKRILLIDDDAFIIRMLSLVLEVSGYQILSAKNGKEAMNILAGQAVDMIILDLMMPEMDGIAFLHWLRKEANITLPTLVLTGMTTADTESQVLAAGATDLIHKPIKKDDLLAKIKPLLEKKAGQ